MTRRGAHGMAQYPNVRPGRTSVRTSPQGMQRPGGLNPRPVTGARDLGSRAQPTHQPGQPAASPRELAAGTKLRTALATVGVLGIVAGLSATTQAPLSPLASWAVLALYVAAAAALLRAVA